MKTKNMMFLTALMLLGTNLMSLNSATISVFDKSTGKNIGYASVFVSNIGENSAKRYLTNKMGELNLAMNDKKVIRVSAVGYKSHYDTITMHEKRAYYLEEDAFNLEQVVITATRTDKKLSDAPIITHIITNEQINRQGINDIRDLLQQELPSVEFLDNGAMGISVNMQGLSAKNILFLIDGERIAGEKNDNIDYTRFNTNNIERIEIIKGAASALYGSQAMGGVINVITKGVNDDFNFNFSANYTEISETNYKNVSPDDNLYTYKQHLDKLNLNGSASVGVKFGNFSSFTDVSYKSADAYQLYDTKGEERYYPELDTTISLQVNEAPTNVDGYENVNIGEKINYDGGSLKLFATCRYFNISKYDFVKDNAYENDIDYSYNTKMMYENCEVTLAGDNYFRYSQSEKSDNRKLIYENDIYNHKILYNYNKFTTHLLTGGAEFLYERLYSDRFTYNVYESRSQWNITAYLQDDWTISEQFSAILGLRIDEHKEYSTNISPKFSAKYHLNPITLRLNYAAGYRSPTLKELYMNWDHQGMFQIIGNSNLMPEINNYLSFSAECVLSSTLYMNATGYFNWFNSKIDGVWGDNEQVFRYTNIGKTTLAGIETTIKLKICDGLFLNTALDYLFIQTNHQIATNIVSPLNISTNLEYSYTKNDYSCSIFFGGSIRDAKRYEVLDSVIIGGVLATYYEAVVPTYSVWHTSISQLFFNKLRLTLGINNVFNYKAPIASFNSTNTIGRRLYVSLQYVY